MSYTFYHTPLCEDITRYIYTFSKKPDCFQKSPTSTLMKSVFMVRTILKYTELSTSNTLYGMLYSKLPFIWLLDKYDQQEWEDHVNSSLYISRII